MNSEEEELPAPPGLSIGSTHGCDNGEGTIEENGVAAKVPREVEFKDQLTRAVLEAVQKDIDEKTAVAVDSLWHRGQRAMQNLQQTQNAQNEQLRIQLAACAESYQNLERENVELRTALEGLMKHLALVFGPPPFPFVPPHAHGAPAQQAQAHLHAAALAAQYSTGSPAGTSAAAHREESSDLGEPSRMPTTPTPGFSSGLVESPIGAQQTPLSSSITNSPQAGVVPRKAGTGAPSSGSSIGGASPSRKSPMVATQAEISTSQPFNITLRRAENVPMGLDVRDDSEAPHLVVESVRPGGAIEAWNRQCAGDPKEIRPGDIIIKINSAEDAAAMREECASRFLLKITVKREAGTTEFADRTGASAAAGLRAEADEFVPQVSQ